MGDSAGAFFQKMLSTIKKKSKPTTQDLAMLCNQLDTWAMFAEDDGQLIKSAAVSVVHALQQHADLQSDDLMLRIYQLVGKYSGTMGKSGVFDKIETQGKFKNSYKFHCMWAQIHAEKKHAQKFREIFEMTSRRIKDRSPSEIAAEFQGIAEEFMPGEFDPAEFGAPATAPRNPRRRSAVAMLHQQAVQNIAPSTSSSTSKIAIKVELIDREDYTPISPEELTASAYSDHCAEVVDMDISVAPPVEKDDDDMEITLQEESAPPPATVRTPYHRMDQKKMDRMLLTPVHENSERDSMSEKRKNSSEVFSPGRTNPPKRSTGSTDREPAFSQVSFSENEYRKAESLFTDTVNLGPSTQPDLTLPVIQNPPDAFEVFEDPEQSLFQQPVRPSPPLQERKPLSERAVEAVNPEKMPVPEEKPVVREEKPFFRAPVAPAKDKEEEFMPDVSAIENDSPGRNYNFEDDPTLAGQKDGLLSHRIPSGIVTSTPFALSNRITHEEFFGKSVELEQEDGVFDMDFGGDRTNKRMSMAKPLTVVKEVEPLSVKEIKPIQDVTLSSAMSKVVLSGSDEPERDLDRTGLVTARPHEDISGDVNPWDASVRNAIMAKAAHQPQHQHEYQTSAPKIHRFRDLNLGGETFEVKDLIGEGGFAKVFKCINENGETVALKYEVPSCAWEVYVCHQLKERLKKNGQLALTQNVMEVTDAYIYKNASLLINEYHGNGNLLDLANKLHGGASSQLILFLAIQIAAVLKEVHRAGIIHGDVKPDNIMVLSKVDENASAEELLSTGVVKFIDWGRAIDIASMPVKEFKGRAGTANFDCPEMLKNLPWNYQTDFFGFVATMHVMIFGKYSKVQIDGNRSCMDQSMKRRLSCRTLMEGLFDRMLNMPSCSQLLDWDDVINEMSDFFKREFTPMEWRQAARVFNDSLAN